jgi:hypothetical protein|tara:strand:+ start:813 stop:1652 length:840 start_codon:yes stop_codon:yes gene_type:complete
MIIWLASYPKSGNTFLRSLLSSYFFTTDGIFNFETLNTIKQFPHFSLFKKIGVNLKDEKQVLENYVKAQELFNTKESLQFVKTHSSLLRGFTNYRNTLGVIYVIRDPRNVVISAANHFNTTIEESVSRLLNNTNLGGDINNNKSANKVTTHLTTWSMHYNSWKALKIRERYLLIKYEDLTKNTEKVFIRILDFIYDLINQKYVLDKLKMKNILKTTSFDYVQQLEKEKNFPEKAKHGEDDEKTFFKYGPNLNKKEILNTKLKDKIETELKNDMTELGYL